MVGSMTDDVQTARGLRLLATFLLCPCAVLMAGVSLTDRWQADGRMSVKGEKWECVFTKGQDVRLVSNEQIVRIVPFPADEAEEAVLTDCEATGSGEGTEVRAVFDSPAGAMEGSFGFDEMGDVRVTPLKGLGGISLRGDIRVGLLPGRILESVVYLPESLSDGDSLRVPNENWYVGFLGNGEGMLACAWPEGGQSVRLAMKGGGAERTIRSINLTLDGKEAYVWLLAARGVWHKETFGVKHLERDVGMKWKPPFANATWRTELPLKAQSTAHRTFCFRNRRSEEWRPEIGNYVWPVWFGDGKAFIHTSKKIPPRGVAVVYPYEGRQETLLGFANRTPVRELFAARSNRLGLPEGPRKAMNVGFNACWGTHLLRRTVYTLGVQEREKEYLTEHIDYLADRVEMVQLRNARYFEFIRAERRKLEAMLEQAKGGRAESYLKEMIDHLDRVEEGHKQKMLMYGEDTPEKHRQRAKRNADRLRELIHTGGPEVYPECERMVDVFNRLGWGHDETTGMRFSMLMREWAARAALDCADEPAAVEYANRLRADLREAILGAAGW